jgi:ABC-type branched-subunit amino acid transport system ATPase component
VRLKGKTLDNLAAWRRSELGLGCLWQDSRVFHNMTVLENLLVAASDTSELWATNSLLHPVKTRLRENNKIEKGHAILKQLHLEERSHVFARDLSYGQQKLLAIGRLIISNAQVMLLDEPLSGLDPAMIDQVVALIQQLWNDGKSILVIEHNPSALMALADLVYVMRGGQIVCAGPTKAVCENVYLKESFLSS